jgi:hypothetical protein
MGRTTGTPTAHPLLQDRVAPSAVVKQPSDVMRPAGDHRAWVSARVISARQLGEQHHRHHGEIPITESTFPQRLPDIPGRR